MAPGLQAHREKRCCGQAPSPTELRLYLHFQQTKTNTNYNKIRLFFQYTKRLNYKNSATTTFRKDEGKLDRAKGEALSGLLRYYLDVSGGGTAAIWEEKNDMLRGKGFYRAQDRS